MKGRLSLLAVQITGAVLLWTRIEYSELRGWSPMKVTTWDAFGYYQYLPAVFIYDDIGRQEWVAGIDSTYHVIGDGGLYQLMELENGNRATKYLGGTAMMELPFFFIGHGIAGLTGHKQDGFSPPYQWAIALAPLVYCILGLFLLRDVLRRWYTDVTVSLVLVLITLATNAIQYISVDGGQTHGFLFSLYCAILWATIKWHAAPAKRSALLIGGIIGLACVTRPTEAIMLFIPLLWNTHTKEDARAKWTLVRQYRGHLLLATASAFVLLLPQLVFWKIVTGSFVFDVGSKWDFFDPHWRVLIGWEKGWFIYTPITLLFIVGLFFMRGKPWWKSVLVFTLLNIWIVIAWHDWRYGGSYSARALVQSYPVLALPFAALVQRGISTRWRWPLLALCTWLLFVNLFQIRQYNNNILRYDGMNRAYYQAIYLDADPSEEDLRFLDPDLMRIHAPALGLTLMISGCSSSDAPTIDTSMAEHQTEVPFTEQDILADLDECGGNAPYKFFLDLDHGYVYTASSHITLFADERRWAIVMEKTGYNPRGGNVPLELNFFGNCLHGLDKAGSDGQFTCNTKFLEVIPGQEMERIDAGEELAKRSADSITIRDQRVPIDQDNANYEAIGIKTRFQDNPDKLLSLEGLVRYLSEKHPDLFRANDGEFRTCLPGDLPRLMTIDRWIHPKDLGLGDGPGPRPSTYETFRTIAKILVTRDTSLWKEPAAPNNDWRFHPDAGSL